MAIFVGHNRDLNDNMEKAQIKTSFAVCLEKSNLKNALSSRIDGAQQEKR
jgi:hypothetical protein